MVDPETIAIAIGRPSPAENSAQYAQWEMWIADATRAIERQADRVGVDFDSLDPDDLDYVVREAVVEMVRNPDGISTVAIQVDDGSVSKRYANSRGRVTILDDWWYLLGLSEPREAFSISPSYTPGCSTRRWPR